jgi:hypothetical protein
LSLFVLSRSDAFAQSEHLALAFGGSDETVEPAFKSEAIDENKPGAGDAAAVSGTGLIDMGVAVRADDGGDGDPVAADLRTRSPIIECWRRLNFMRPPSLA